MKVPTVLVRSRKWEARFLDCEAQLLFLFICTSPSPYSHRLPPRLASAIQRTSFVPVISCPSCRLSHSVRVREA